MINGKVRRKSCVLCQDLIKIFEHDSTSDVQSFCLLVEARDGREI